MRGSMAEQMQDALADLWKMGYRATYPSDARLGQKVRVLTRNGKHETALIQTRSNQPDTQRYLVGLVVPDLERVDTVIVWFEGEPDMFMAPADELRKVLAEEKKRGTAKYSSGGRQWRVDFYLDEKTISPQGSNGYRYYLNQFFVSREVKR